MEFFISSAFAQQGGEGTGWTALLFPIVLIAIFYFLLIRPQAKRAKEHKKLISELDKGDEVVTQGGLLGRITEVEESFITMEINDGNQVKVQRNAVAQVVPKGTMKGKADPAETKKTGK
ncbi:preprotein translocase subunit YajC [Aquisalimonas lutea]|uniref:preprotein translocase subunit YajC n=1 Tax=Aquisalimonas lutea TaxID=1327750 RepID=UPI0025B40B14|nr:preprotein translocase subunit YajC [Aquisalimonas lutea]MDN3517884.1 preprotein translocase subunit YajC [Aquisalimonas lutea]